MLRQHKAGLSDKSAHVVELSALKSQDAHAVEHDTRSNSTKALKTCQSARVKSICITILCTKRMLTSVNLPDMLAVDTT